MAIDRSVHVSVLVALLLLQAAGRAAPERVWTNASFEDFRQGEFEDHGANTYVSKRGRVQLINRWDLNNDGYLDIVFSNTHSHAEKVDATIFWGNGRDFDNMRATPLPNDGAQHTTLADLDKDGVSEFIVSNYSNGTWDGMDSYVVLR